MIGQTKTYSKHQDIVDRFLEETDPYTSTAPIPFDLHGYLNYVTEHHIEDPDAIPADVMNHFFENADGKDSEAS